MSTNPPPSSPPEEQMPRAIIIPRNLSEEDHAAIARSIYNDHGVYILRTLLLLGDLQEASAQDIRQRVILIVRDRLAKHAVEGGEELTPEEKKALVRDVTLKKASEWKRARRRRPDVLRTGDGDADDAPTSAMDPERALALAQHKAKVARELHALPAIEAAVMRAIDLEEGTLDEAAAKLGMSRSAVSRLHIRVMKELRAKWAAER